MAGFSVSTPNTRSWPSSPPGNSCKVPLIQPRVPCVCRSGERPFAPLIWELDLYHHRQSLSAAHTESVVAVLSSAAANVKQVSGYRTALLANSIQVNKSEHVGRQWRSTTTVTHSWVKWRNVKPHKHIFELRIRNHSPFVLLSFRDKCLTQHKPVFMQTRLGICKNSGCQDVNVCFFAAPDIKLRKVIKHRSPKVQTLVCNEIPPSEL